MIRVRRRGTTQSTPLLVMAFVVVLTLLAPSVARGESIAATQRQIAQLSATLAQQEKNSEITANAYDAAKANLATLTINIANLQSQGGRQAREDQDHHDRTRHRRGARLRPRGGRRADPLTVQSERHPERREEGLRGPGHRRPQRPQGRAPAGEEVARGHHLGRRRPNERSPTADCQHGEPARPERSQRERDAFDADGGHRETEDRDHRLRDPRGRGRGEGPQHRGRGHRGRRGVGGGRPVRGQPGHRRDRGGHAAGHHGNRRQLGPGSGRPQVGQVPDRRPLRLGWRDARRRSSTARGSSSGPGPRPAS